MGFLWKLRKTYGKTMENIRKHMEFFLENIGKHMGFLWKLRKTYRKTMGNIGKHMENLWEI